ALATDLVGRRVSVIVAPGGAPAALAAKSATTAIPIVFEMGADPIAIGLVGSLSHPGGNLTGVTSLSVEVTPKRLEFLHEMIPTAGLIAVLVNPTSPTAASQSKSFRIRPATGGYNSTSCRPVMNEISIPCLRLRVRFRYHVRYAQ